MKTEKPKTSFAQWRDFFLFLKKAKVPWYIVLVTFFIDALGVTLFVKLPAVLGEIMDGNIFDSVKIAQYGLLAFGETLFGILSVVLSWVIGMMICSKSALGAWSKVLRLPMSHLDQEGHSSLTSRVTWEPAQVSEAVNCIFYWCSSLYSLILVYVEMFKLHTGMATILLSVPVLVAISMAIVGRLGYDRQKRVADSLSLLTSYLAVRLPNARMIKAFGMQRAEQKAGQEYMEARYHADMKVVVVNTISTAMQELTNAFVNIVVVGYGAYLVGSGRWELGEFVAFFLFAAQGMFIWYAQSLVMYYTSIKIGMGGCSKMAELIDSDEEDISEGKSFTVPEADIVFDNVSFGYGDQYVLQNVNMTIPKGKMTAIVGTNGSGKSTILKLIERLYEPDSGKITYGGEDAQKYKLNDWRGSIGYVMQNSPLLIGTIADNISYGMEQSSNEQVADVAKLVGAYEFITKMEDGFDTPVGEMGGKLSGGQRQKLAIARAMVRKPELYLLDEATCGLDVCSEQEITEMLNKYLRGKTSVVIAHNLETIRMADQIVVLQDGRVACTGTHDSLMRDSELYRSFFGVK